MSYDIVDVMKGFTQELYNLRAINNFETDYQLTKYLMNERGVSGVAPRDIIKNANEQLNNMERRILILVNIIVLSMFLPVHYYVILL